MLRLSRRFKSRRAFVTGGASGLGEALCLLLADDGWTVVIADLHEERLAATADAVRARGGRPVPKKLDVTDPDAYRQVVDEVVAELGGMDLVVNNAGVAGSGLVGDYSIEDWHWLLDVNLRGVVHGCTLFAPILKAQKSGHILNTASAAALFPIPEMSAYCVSKCAVLMLSEVLVNELKPFHVGVSVIMPEFFQTNLHEGMRGDIEATKMAMRRSKRSAAEVARFALDEAGRERVHLVYPRWIHAAWWARRTFPASFLPLVRMAFQKSKAVIDAHKAKLADENGAEGHGGGEAAPSVEDRAA